MKAPPRNPDRRRFSVAVIGCGAIGSFVCLLLARLPGLETLVLVDSDSSFTEANLVGQNIFLADVRAGLPKVEVMRRMVKAIRREVKVTTFCCPVVQVPLGWLAVDLILVCVDSKESRLQVNQLAWRLGVPLIDAGVYADGKLVRVSTIFPGLDQPCLECSWDEGDYAALDQRFPCMAGRSLAPATHASSCLGSLVASLQVLSCESYLTARPNFHPAARQLVIDALSRRLCDTSLCRHEGCRFDHHSWRIHPLSKSPWQMTLREALDLPCTGRRGFADSVLRVEPGFFVRMLACRCGRRRDVLLLSGRGGCQAMKCQRCGRQMHGINPGASARLRADELTPAELRLPLWRCGFRPGDVFGVGAHGAEIHYRFPLR